MTYQIVDWLITYIECFVMLVVVTESGGRKFEEKKQAYLLLSFSLLNAILVAVCNRISVFFFYYACVVYFIFNSNFTHPFTRKFSAAYLHKHYDHVCYSNDGVYSYGYILLALWWRSILHSV